ncbi:disease resistance protein RPV1 [Populus trichocarpa]|uniref:disease resistance protein RPV1 n=1 Tax=Populus trichocarpa TaxID=3694 RepID=UPI00227766A9|nr:disease resistance protein RPV1 [Populus trichocarpa]
MGNGWYRQQSDLRRRFLKRLLGQETLNTMGSLSFRDSFVRDRLRRIKVFIVLDDVDNSMALEEWRDLLDGRNSSFGPGSKVLITSRDKQVLSNIVDETYKVEGLNYADAIQLFSSKALKNCIPTIDQRHLIIKNVRHVQGNPLALKVLGSSLYDKSIEEWRSALKKLALDPQIERALRISYDGLDLEQKPIFLDIAHFFKGRMQGEATGILDCLYGQSVNFDISTLIDKCLISTAKDYFHRDKLEMHDLLQEMAFNIVRAESDFPGERSRLSHPPDVVQLLEENKGTQQIKGISLDMSMLSRQIHLKSDAFAMMDGLRFLNIYFSRYSKEDKILHLPPTGLEYLPNELRYFLWSRFPLKSLPPSFRAEHLVELHLRKSKLVKLWTGVKDVGNLRRIDLSDSPYLTELPDLSMAKNLVSLDLTDCPSLIEVPSSLQYLDKLEKIYLFRCYNLRSFPMLDSKVLRFLLISRCLDVTTCPTISQNMEWLWLEQTSIKEVPQSVTGKLERLCLSGCPEITKFPEISGDIEILDLRGTAIKEVPSSIQFLTRLEVLDMSGCSKLESLPEITVPMESLHSLKLSKTGIKEIPSSLIKHMISLTFLNLDGTPIKALPELPPSLRYLTTHDCASLETVTSSINIGRLELGLDFTNCFKLDQKPLVAAMHLKIQSGEEIPDGGIQMVLPGSEIPEWFGDKGIGSSLTMQLPSNCHQLKGIAFCLVFLLPLPSHDMPYEVDDDIDVNLYLDYHVKSKNGEHDGDDEVVLASGERCHLTSKMKTCDSDHMVLHYMALRYELELVNRLRKYSGNEVTFKFYHHEVVNMARKVGNEIQRPFKLKSCGVYLHFGENLPADTDGYRYLPVNKQRFRRK